MSDKSITHRFRHGAFSGCYARFSLAQRLYTTGLSFRWDKLYNSRGELETTALDLANTGVIDFEGTDRITRTTSSVENSALRGTVLRKTVTELWETNGVSQSTVLQTSETSADGTQTWTTQYGLTTHTTTAIDRANQRRTVTTTNPDGTSTVTVFEQGRQKSVTRLDKNGARVSQTTFAYDPFGRLQTQTDARNGPTTYAYYDDGQLHTVTTPDPDPGASGPGLDPQTTSYTYYRDPAHGIKTVTTLPDGGVVTQEYFPSGQLKKTWGARTYPAEYTYDRAGRMATLTTWQQFNFATGTGIAGSATTRWNYNARGLLANKRYADNKGPGYTYTAGGKLETRIWARGVLTTYGYDAQTGDLLTLTYSDATPAVTNTYARSGQLQSVLDASGLRTFGYRHGQTATEAYGPGLFAGFTLVRDYDNLDRQAALSVTSPTGAVYHVTYGYDAASRLSAVTSGVDVATYAYHPDSGLVHTLTQAHSNAVRLTTTKLYDKLGRLQSITSVPSADSPIRFAYDYNDANQRTRATLANGEYWTYGYDPLGQVTNGVKRFPNGAPIPGYSFGYSFDQIGNRLSASRETKTDAYTNNALNQIAGINYSPWLHVLGQVSNNATLTVNGQTPIRTNGYFYAQLPATNAWNTISVQARAVGQATKGTDALAEETGHLFQPTNAVTLQYDDDGNLLSDGRWSMTWDAENRVIKKEKLATVPHTAQHRLEYALDSFGRRVRVTVSEGGSGIWRVASSRLYLANSLEMLAEMDALARSVAQSYIWGLDLTGTRDGAAGVGGLLILETRVVQPAVAQVSSFDGNGNVQALTHAASGSLSAQYEYDPFGGTLKLSGSAAPLNFLRFSTKLAEQETADSHYESRDYRPSLGRWLSRDLQGEEASYNIYGFCNNQPMNLVDFLGQVAIYLHTEGWGHLGVQVHPTAGSEQNYDFGRYYGTYKYWYSYSGPNILRRTQGKPYVLKKAGGRIHELETSPELDSIIAKKFAGTFASGKTDIPGATKKKMEKWKTSPGFTLQGNERYMGSDWGFTGPNCVTFSFETLYAALDDVIKDKKGPDKLKSEACQLKEKLEKLETQMPSGVAENIDEQ
ncbi:MAG: RHS repeat-associated core domain-containing protein [Verrucomicrobiales bacterium]|nr:RHS repeat-associated core domain-containing protein [Verrucomicrobiales bacterium]